MLTMPTLRQVRSPNFSPTPIRHDLFVFHRMEGSYEGSIAWLCDPRANASAQGCMKIDGSEDTQLVPANQKAWHACAFNSRGVGWEIEGFTRDGMADVTLNAAALRAAWYCLAYGVPPVWAQGGLGRGICTHHDLGIGGGGHVDICGVGDALWQRCVTATQNAYAALKAQGLPVWALNGAPGPHEVQAAPFVPATPSHNGAQRNEPGDVHEHPTASGYPAHSIAALQADLNALGASPALIVDGGFGPKTAAALMAFQITHGLQGDGMIGPLSWAALDAAVAALP